MAVMHRALFTWLTILVFLILLVLRLEYKVTWNWFLIFIPLWLFDCVVLLYITINMIRHCRRGFDRNDVSMRRKVYYMTAVLLKMTFQILLCLRFEYFNFISLYMAMIPFWVLLTVSCTDIFIGLVKL
ncbi:hypothetical protein LOTGIDRAFT_195820 [Lottia gigantea]|uniref:Transmembrane protein 60 n=1 Tax=Lottia gigantea TaxID=225164 RepID=V4B8X6_LOTGI|nr:hypothetical protein LOTGIDRAFT_195820 [Lottia gigantea]ESO85294.1 hypothetical protein LOTGIDRAFT_195820 [Lottia gigantea]